MEHDNLEGRAFTLRRAIVLTVVISLLAPVLLISGYSWFKQYNDEIKKQTAELLQQNADILTNGMQEPLWNINQESGNALLEAMLLRNEDIIQIEVRDNALGVFVSGERAERRTGFTAITEKPVLYRNNTIGSVKIEVGSARLRANMIRGLRESITAVLAQAALSIMLILILLDRRLVRPLRRLGTVAERLAARQLDVPFTWQKLDEIGMLGRRMEDTRLSLRRLFEELDQKNRELEQDIDKRKRIERELYEREERFRALVEESPIAIIEWDSTYCVIEWNTAAERIFGYPREQALGKHASLIAPNANREMADTAFRRLTADLGASRHITQNRRADGRIITCQWSHNRIADKTGKSDRLLSIAEDITEKRRAEEALSLSEAKFAGAFQCNPDSISISRMRDGVMIDVNQTFEELSGYMRDETVGKTAIALGLWAFPEQRHVLMQDLSASRMVRNFEWEMRTKFGALRKCVTNATIFSAGSERYMLAVIRDITDKRRIESEIRELNATLEQRVIERTEELQQTNEELANALDTLNKAQEELVRSEKLAALGSLVAGIAHELNTPIGNSLIVASTLAQHTRELSDAYSGQGMKRSMLETYIGNAGQAGDILMRNLQRAADLVNGFKQVAVDQTSSQRRKFSVAEVVSEIMLTLWPSLKKTSFVVKQDIPDTLMMDSYPGPFGQVVTNLVNNALLHGFEGRQSGTVTISAEAIGEGWLELTVKDDGIGIPPSNLNRIFDPFFTTKLGAGGSGIGLSIVHNIVSGILGGRLRVRSQPGEGSAFTLSLPLVAPQPQGENKAVNL